MSIGSMPGETVTVAPPPASRLAFVLPAVFALLVTLLGQWWRPRPFDPDEGINLGKGALVAAGYHPYADLWNDQPPVLTYLLAAIQWLLPWNVGAARVAVLLFACLLLFAVFRIVERSAGTPAAVTSVVLLATAPLMWRLSVSVLIGLPAVALAMAASAIVYRRDDPGLVRGVIAGLVFALSLQTKLFTAAALPAFLAIAWLSGDRSYRASRLARTIVVLAATGAGFLAIGMISGEPLFTQLVTPHVDGDVRAGYSPWRTALRLGEQLIQQPFILVAAVLSVFPAWRGASPLRAAWAIWIACALVVLLGHTPIWYHHALAVVVPMACLGGESLWRFLAAHRASRQTLARRRIPLAVLASALAVAYLLLLLRPFHFGEWESREAAARLGRYAARDPWVITDQPFAAFQAGLLVAPEIIVFSRKRIEAGNLDPETLRELIASRRPGQVLLRNANATPAVRAQLERDYVRVSKSRLHYLRPDLVD